MENTENIVVEAPVNPLDELKAKRSYFSGRLIALIGINLLTAFLCIITIGLAYPAMYCMKKRWVYKNTVVNGYRLKFTGTGGQLFGKYILWSFLTIITFSIFSWWLPIKYQQWETKHVEIDCIDEG